MARGANAVSRAGFERPIRMAAIGLGWVARHRHLPVMDRSRAFEVLGVIDHTQHKAREVARKHHYPHYATTDDLATIPWLDQIDAVTISTPPTDHYHLAEQALASGKHVLIEKPFTMTVAEAEKLSLLAQTADRRIAIVHNFQFTRSMRRLLNDLKAGHFGAITAIQGIQLGNPRRRLPAWYEDLPLGLFYDESPHLLYLMRKLVGPLRVVRVLSVRNSRGMNTPQRIDIYFASGSDACPITLHCNFESPVSEWFLTVFGKHRLGIVDLFRDIYIALPNDNSHEAKHVLRTSLTMTSQHWRQHLASGWGHFTGRLLYGNEEVFKRFAHAINGDPDAIAPIGAESALAVLRLQHEIIDRQEAYRLGQENAE